MAQHHSQLSLVWYNECATCIYIHQYASIIDQPCSAEVHVVPARTLQRSHSDYLVLYYHALEVCSDLFSLFLCLPQPLRCHSQLGLSLLEWIGTWRIDVCIPNMAIRLPLRCIGSMQCSNKKLVSSQTFHETISFRGKPGCEANILYMCMYVRCNNQ